MPGHKNHMTTSVFWRVHIMSPTVTCQQCISYCNNAHFEGDKIPFLKSHMILAWSFPVGLFHMKCPLVRSSALDKKE